MNQESQRGGASDRDTNFTNWHEFPFLQTQLHLTCLQHVLEFKDSSGMGEEARATLNIYKEERCSPLAFAFDVARMATVSGAGVCQRKPRDARSLSIGPRLQRRWLAQLPPESL
jgi:hypothetical protein